MREEGFVARYDDLRRQVRLYGLRREASVAGEESVIVRHLGAEGDGMILYAHLDPAVAEEMIRAEVEAAGQRGGSLEWPVYAHDVPADLGERLRAQGFVAGEKETVLLLPLAGARLPEAPAEVVVRRAGTEEDFAAVAAIRQQTWGGDAGAMARRLQARAEERPEEVVVYLATVDGVAAATGQITFYAGQDFASLASAATLPDYRRRGLYSALLRTRLEAAAERGVRFVDCEASEMSRPLLERVGFRVIAEVVVYVWAPER